MFAFVAVDLAKPVGFALDQDTGGAIRAAGRCDVYMGVGDDAGKLARNIPEGSFITFSSNLRVIRLPGTADRGTQIYLRGKRISW